MEIMHPHLRLAASLILTAGLVSACGGGGSSGAAAPAMPDPDPDPMPGPEPTEVRMPEGCMASDATCTVTVTEADGTVTETKTENMNMTRTVTVTVGGNLRTITRTTDYGGTSPVTTVTTYMGGRPKSRMVGDLTTDIEYSSSNGGRTETTVKSTGTLVQKFSQFTGGTATSTTFTSTNDLVVTENNVNVAGHRRETTYASASDAMNGRNPVSMMVGAPAMTGTPAMTADTGFAAGTVTRTTFTEVAGGGRTLVEYMETVTIVASGDAPAPVITSRTYITAEDSMGRETKRERFVVTDGDDGAVNWDVTTTYPMAGGNIKVKVTRVLTSGSERTTTATTNTMRQVTTVVRVGLAMNGPIIRTVVTSPDGSTVATTGGVSREDGDPAVGVTVSVKTNSDGTKVTTTSTGAGTEEDPRVATMVVTTDENGVEIEQVMYTSVGTGANIDKQGTKETTRTAYMPTGGSTATTVTETREDAASGYETTKTVVVTNDARGRETRRVTMDDEGEVTDTRDTVYDPTDGSSTATRTYSGGTGDELMDTEIVTRDVPAAGMTIGEITDYIVVHPGIQSHAIVSDPQYEMIRTGMAARPTAKTVMGQAVLHLNYKDDDAFNSFSTGSPTMMNLELEAISESPDCATSGCTYSDFRPSSTTVGVAPIFNPEVRIFDSGTPGTLLNSRTDSTGLTNAYRGVLSFGDISTEGRRQAESVLIRTLADLLSVGGAGVDVTYTEPSATYVANGASAATGATPAVIANKFVVKRADATTLERTRERKTFTHLLTAGLADRVLGIGQQVKEVDSHMRLGGTSTARTADDPNSRDGAVRVKVENYFGWMANSMFTVRRVTAQGVAGEAYDWVNNAIGGASADPDATEEARAYIGMASGDPSIRPELRRVEGMTDPATWTGEMIGVGSIQGERYRGDAKVTVRFNDNRVTTAFNNIRLAPNNISISRPDPDDSTNTIETGALSYQHHVARELTSGIEFTSTGIQDSGSYTSSTLIGGVTETPPTSSLTAQFYGTEAMEVAGTFNAYGLALSKQTDPATARDDIVDRGDVIGAFGAARDAMMKAEDN